MPKVSPLQDSFQSGEFSPLLYGRVTADRYKSALKTCKNYIPTLQGGLTRRAGTKFVSEVKDSSAATRLIRFEFSTTQAYILEFGNQYIRFYKDNAIITNTAVNITGITQANPAVVTAASHGYSNGDRVIITGVLGMVQVNNREFIVANQTTNTFELQTTGAVNVNSTGYTAYASGGTVAEVYEIATSYVTADLFELKFTQSADVLYIVHPDYPPAKLSRTGHTSWTIEDIVFQDGPYLSTNTTSTTLTPSAATGTGITLTASAVTGINNDTGFQTTDVGRIIRLQEGSTWGWVTITARTSTTVVTVTVNATLTNTNAKTNWRLGTWSETTGYPQAVTFHEDRLFLGGPTEYPQRLDGSRSGDYENFAPSDTDGTITDSHAVAFTFNANDVNVIRWFSPDEKGLLVGTVGGEWVVRPSTQSEALSATNVNAKQATSVGSANIEPVRSGKGTIFVQRAARKVREMSYFFDVDGFRSPDVSLLSEHITDPGIVELSYQKTPQSIVWLVRSDGTLLGMTYERDLENLKVGWHRHTLGGTGNAAGDAAEVESVAVIPSADGTRDEAWVAVKRYINGATVRYVEYITKIFEDSDLQRDAFFVDCGLTYDNPLTISGATSANPVVITSTAHGLSDGDKILITGVKGMTELNGNTYLIANSTSNTFELTDLSGTDIDGSAFTTYVSGGEARELVSTISGLTHLEGETIGVMADGAAQPDVTVSGGVVTLSLAAATVHLGYNYNSDGQLLRLEAGSADGTALGKTRRTHRVGMLLHRSLGLQIGFGFTELDTVTFRTSEDPLTRAPALFSGIISENVGADYDYENEFCWRQSQPLPSTILAIAPQMVTQDRG